MVAKGLQLLPNCHVITTGLVIIDGQLNNGNVGIWEHMPKDGPCSVVKPPIMVGMHGSIGYQSTGGIRDVGCTRCRVLNAEQLTWEALEIVDGPRVHH